MEKSMFDIAKFLLPVLILIQQIIWVDQLFST
jgi:hypothetical protein